MFCKKVQLSVFNPHIWSSELFSYVSEHVFLPLLLLFWGCWVFFNLCYSSRWWQRWAEAHGKVFLKKTKQKKHCKLSKHVNIQSSLITNITKIWNLKIWWNGISLIDYLIFVTFLPYSVFLYCTSCMGRYKYIISFSFIFDDGTFEVEGVFVWNNP